MWLKCGARVDSRCVKDSLNAEIAGNAAPQQIAGFLVDTGGRQPI
jgi:hypothetical protein